MNVTIAVENIKCGGCANTIVTKMGALEGVEGVTVNIEEGVVAIEGQNEDRQRYCEALAAMGYPEVDTLHGLSSVGAKAKSFVSCAVGRINQ
ncbi:heavy-metal-associated domain-containing protein [Ectothiorhodospiraceae bacterium BW-2]|nr:heavy-metal-associated domain-containing protein [Ectothiorhodospiraceae bacterium BW-2]